MKKEITIGRDLSSDIVIPDTCDKSSRNHAVLIIENGNVVLEDCSTNGTYVNGIKYRNDSIVIKPGDSLIFPGGYTLNWSSISAFIPNPNAETRRMNSQTIRMNNRSVAEESVEEINKKGYTSIKYDGSQLNGSEKYISNQSNGILSFNGRCGRGEYWGISLIANILYYAVSFFFYSVYISDIILVSSFVFAILYLWVVLAVGARRCHDLGHSGWFQIIPLYFLWLAFASGERRKNEYG